MNFLTRLKLWITKMLIRLRQYQPKRPFQTPISLQNAGSIAILYKTNKTSHKRKAISKFEKELKKQNKSVHLMEYMEDQNNAEHEFSHEHFSFFTDAHLNFLGLPKKAVIQNFSQQSFDLLICQCEKECLPLYYSSAIAKADFKVGMYNPSYTHIFDLMFEFEPDNIQNNLNTLATYLGKIEKN